MFIFKITSQMNLLDGSFFKYDKTFASDLYLIYKLSPSARVCISDTDRLLMFYLVHIDIILRAGTSIYASSGFGPLGPNPCGGHNTKSNVCLTVLIQSCRVRGSIFLVIVTPSIVNWLFNFNAVQI